MHELHTLSTTLRAYVASADPPAAVHGVLAMSSPLVSFDDCEALPLDQSDPREETELPGRGASRECLSILSRRRSAIPPRPPLLAALVLEC